MSHEREARQQAHPNETRPYNLNLAYALAKSPIRAAKVLSLMLTLGRSLNHIEAEPRGGHRLPAFIRCFAADHRLSCEQVPEQAPNKRSEPCLVAFDPLPEIQRKPTLQSATPTTPMTAHR